MKKINELEQLIKQYQSKGKNYKDYYEKNKDKILTHKKEKYNAMTEEQRLKRNEFHREYRKNNKDKVRKANKTYRDKMTEEEKIKYKEYQRLYREKKLNPHPTDAIDALRASPALAD